MVVADSGIVWGCVLSKEVEDLEFICGILDKDQSLQIQERKLKISFANRPMRDLKLIFCQVIILYYLPPYYRITPQQVLQSDPDFFLQILDHNVIENVWQLDTLILNHAITNSENFK